MSGHAWPLSEDEREALYEAMQEVAIGKDCSERLVMSYWDRFGE